MPFRILHCLTVHLLPLLLLPLWPATLYAAQSPSEDEEEAPAIFGLGLLDQTQSLASDSANALARQLDRFFGVQRSDIEAAYSALRLTGIQSWNDIENGETGLRLRGKLHLPRINERISLIFSEEDGDGTGQQNVSAARQESTRVNLELNVTEQEAHRVYFRVGMRSNLKGRLSMRYRYEPARESDTVNRFTQSLYFKDGDGFGAFTRHQLDHTLSEQSLLRWTNDLRFEESFTGSQWSTSLELLQQRSNQTAMSWYGRINGVTSPGFVVSYDLGFRLRRTIGREWLFLEVEPGYTWRKEAWNIEREGTPFIFLRLEMAIGTFI